MGITVDTMVEVTVVVADMVDTIKAMLRLFTRRFTTALLSADFAD